MDRVLKIEGMSCQNRVANVKSALEAVEGVEETNVDLDGGLARLKGEHLVQDALAAAIDKAGYKVVD